MSARGLIVGTALVVAISLSIGNGATETPEALGGETPCTGDCNFDLSVGVGEIVFGVGVALGRNDLSSCERLDSSGNGGVEVDELVAAVLNSFNECGSLGLRETALRRVARGDLQNARSFFVAASATEPSDVVEIGAAVTGVVSAVLQDGRLRALAKRSGLFLSGDARDV